MTRYGLFFATTLAALTTLSAYGQFSSESTDAVTVTVSQPNTSPSSNVAFSITLNSPLNASLNDVVSQLSSIGITAANFSALGSTTITNSSATSPSLAWTFTLTVPPANVKTTIAALTALQSNLGQNGSGYSLSFTLSEVTTVSSEACNFPALMSAARAQAESLAVAAGQTLGSVIGLSSGNTVCELAAKFSLGYQSAVSSPNLVTVNLSQPATVQFDQAGVLIGVVSGLNSGLQDVTTALQTAGISGPTFLGVSTTYAPSEGLGSVLLLGWAFQIDTPIANLGALLSQLTTAQQTFQKENPTLNLAFMVGGAFASQPPVCSASSMLAAAQTEAQQLAAAASVNLGSVLNLSTTYPIAAGSPNYSNLQYFLFQAAQGLQAVTSEFGGLAVSACTLGAQFQLL